MSNLEVKNGVFRYQDTNFQISQITTIEKASGELDNAIKKFRFWKLVVIVVCILVLYYSYQSYSASDISTNSFLLLGGVSIVTIVILLKYISWHSYNKLYMYGFYIEMPNGTVRGFWSDNKSKIYKIYNKIVDAMNGKDINYSTNVNIKVNNSKDVNSTVNINN